MTITTEKHTSNNGFAIPLQDDTDLGLALLIVEDKEGHYEPVANVSTINEAKELAADDLRQRLRRLESNEDPGLCPFLYKLWARGIDGEFRGACEIEAQRAPVSLEPSSRSTSRNSADQSASARQRPCKSEWPARI